MTKRKKRADGRYAVQVYIGMVDGKRKVKTVYGTTKKEVEEKAEQVRASLRKGLDVTADRDTFGEWADRWYKIKEAEVSAGRMAAYDGALAQLKPLASMQLVQIKVFDLQQIIADLAQQHPVTGKPAARKTLLTVRSVAKQVFDLAIENRVLDFNPAVYVRMPACEPPEERRALTREEQRWIVETPHRARRAAMIMMYAGLRRGELIPLTWRDIDLQNRTIRVTKSVEIVHGKSQKKVGGKTAYSTRTVDIPQILTDYLTRECEADRQIARETGEPMGLNALVCTTAAGKMHNSTSWRRMWESYQKELNIRYGHFITPPKSKMQPGGVPMVIPHITAHWLRHTFATMLYLSGVDVLTAKEQLGHADIKTTLEIYTHLDAEHRRKNIIKLDEYISSQKDDVSQIQVNHI